MEKKIFYKTLNRFILIKNFVVKNKIQTFLDEAVLTVDELMDYFLFELLPFGPKLTKSCAEFDDDGDGVITKENAVTAMINSGVNIVRAKNMILAITTEDVNIKGNYVSFLKNLILFVAIGYCMRH